MQKCIGRVECQRIPRVIPQKSVNMEDQASSPATELEILEEKQGSYTAKIYNISQIVETTIQKKATEILSDFQQEKFLPVLYTILKELIINACKANQKRVFFEENGYDIHDPESYRLGIKEYKKILNEEMVEYYGQKARLLNLYCQISFCYSKNGFTLKIQNNTPIAYQEERAIRDKLAKAMNYDDIAMFYMDNADNTEGAGLGLALIIIMLKGENIDPGYFRIITGKDITTARLEIPFNEDFKSVRDR